MVSDLNLLKLMGSMRILVLVISFMLFEKGDS